ncbi:unnamed protein product [Pleuronectes platessa]|uniref:Uncharacterized protein n=1 Tax=Pleuronectes platessa TaxID=8262 RepID=A0A9N7YMH6_PLEPL|nr:unnamed protein product [Pleuronectes platessa]
MPLLGLPEANQFEMNETRSAEATRGKGSSAMVDRRVRANLGLCITTYTFDLINKSTTTEWSKNEKRVIFLRS